MSEPIAWTNEQRKLSQLIPWGRNPRQIKADQVNRLQNSLTEFGQVEPVCIGPANELYNGHQRLKSWAAKFGDIAIDVRVSSRPLTEKEREKLTIYLHKGAAGEWNFDTLSEWDVPDLLEWGFKEYELGIVETGNDTEKNWQNMPDFESEDKTAFRSIIIHFETPEDVENFSKVINQTITEKTKSIWHPYKPHDVLKNIGYKDES